MGRLEVYLDTSVISYLFHDDRPERPRETEKFFENTIATKAHAAFISAIVLDELSRTKDALLREQFLNAVRKYDLSMLAGKEGEVERMAKVYMACGILPPKMPEDALHVAFATVFDMDTLVTWNFRHLARARTADLVHAANIVEGFYKPLRILIPLELLEP